MPRLLVQGVGPKGRPGAVRTLSAVAFLAALAVGGGPVRADDLPSGEEVISRYVEATGGKAWESVRTLQVTGTLGLPAMGMSGTITTYFDAKGDYRVEVEIPGVGQQLQGSTEGVLWELSMMSGPRIIEGEEAAASLRQSDLMWHQKLDEYYSAVECVGAKEYGGENCYEVRLTPKSGAVETHFYSVETGLQRGSSITVKHQMGDIPATTTIEKYQEFSGLQMPTRMVQSAAGMEQVIEITDVKVNPKLPEGKLETPAEIRALLEPAGK